MSTCAITVSLVTRVTIPGSRLRALTALARVRVPVGVVGELLGQLRQVGTADHGASAVGSRPDPPPVDPAAQGVVADPEQLGCLRNPVRRHA